MKADDMKMLSALAGLGVRVPHQGCCLDVKGVWNHWTGLDWTGLD